MAKRRRRRWLGALAALVVPVAIGVVAVDYFRFLHGPLRPGADEPVVVTIDPGMPVAAVARALADRGLLDRPLYFRLTARVTGDARRIQAGEYSIDPATTPYRLLDNFVAGAVKSYELTIIEGWTFAEMMAAIREHEALDHELEARSGAAVMTALGRDGEHPEGRFFPDTYSFPRGFSDRALMQRALRRMDRVLAEEWRNRSADLPLESAYQALILASIVERETAVATERARIAGVFIERLDRGMRLQTDPTVIYGLGEDFDGNLTRRDLLQDTPYNTYTHAGLPPTPIALPSRASIRAALQPERRGELYFVSTGDGRHVFSKTLEEHNRAVARYQLGRDVPAPRPESAPSAADTGGDTGDGDADDG